ncbi:MAG: hypothetical protein ACRENE_27625 [Polyangiaceae bacterium]
MRARYWLAGGALCAVMGGAAVQGCSSSSGGDAGSGDDGSTADGASSGSSSGSSGGSTSSGASSGGSSSGSSSSSSSSSGSGSGSSSGSADGGADGTVEGGSSSGASSSGGSSSGSGSDAGTEAATDSGADGAITCTYPSTSSLPAETVNIDGGAFPTTGATGGTIYPGTYYETQAYVFGDASAPGNTRDAFLIDTANMTLAEAQPKPDGGGSTTFLATYTTSGSTLTLTGVAACGSSGSKQAGYTATTNTLTIYDPGSGRVSTFTLQ